MNHKGGDGRKVPAVVKISEDKKYVVRPNYCTYYLHTKLRKQCS